MRTIVRIYGYQLESEAACTTSRVLGINKSISGIAKSIFIRGTSNLLGYHSRFGARAGALNRDAGLARDFATQASNPTLAKNSKTIIRPSVSQPQELSNSFGRRRESKPLYEQQCRKRTEKSVRSFPRFAPSAEKPWYRSTLDLVNIRASNVAFNVRETLFSSNDEITWLLRYLSLPRKTRRQSLLGEMSAATVLLTTCLSECLSVEVFRLLRTVW